MGSTELEGLTWIAVHGRGVLHTAQGSQIALTLSQAGINAGREAYYYMRYDDSPERVQLPLIYYSVLGKPSIDVVLPEEVQPIGETFNAVAVLDSSMLVHKTSQRALMLDGSKPDCALVVNTSMKPEQVLKLVKKYNCAQDWNGRIITVRSSRYHTNLVYGVVGALTKALDGEITLENVVDSMEAAGNKVDALDAVRQSHEDAEPMPVSLKAAECEPFKTKSKLLEAYRSAPSIQSDPWDRVIYMQLKQRAAEAPTYESRTGSMPRWEVLAPGLIEFNQRPGERNIGFKTSFARTFRPVRDPKLCIDCKLCHIFCPDGAVDFNPIRIDYEYCKGCGVCASVCGPKAIFMIHELKALEDIDEQEFLTLRKALIEYAY